MAKVVHSGGSEGNIRHSKDGQRPGNKAGAPHSKYGRSPGHIGKIVGKKAKHFKHSKGHPFSDLVVHGSR